MYIYKTIMIMSMMMMMRWWWKLFQVWLSPVYALWIPFQRNNTAPQTRRENVACDETENERKKERERALRMRTLDDGW